MELLILCISILSLILFPSLGAKGAAEGIRLCGTTLIPALFPFFFLTRVLSERLPWPKSSKAFLGYSSQAMGAVALSFVGGYPTGVVSAVSLYKCGRISEREAKRLIPLCNNSGPGFFVGVLGAGIFGDVRKGLCLYLIHVLTALVMVLLIGGEREPVQIRPIGKAEPKPLSQVLQDALGDSCNTMLRVCGLVILFSVLRQLLVPVLPGELLPYWGLVELSSGLPATGEEHFILWAVLMGWGGLCVHLQAMSIWQEAGLDIKGYFSKKCLHAILSGLCAAGVVYGKWMVFPLLFLLSFVFSQFRKKWGRKKQHLAL